MGKVGWGAEVKLIKQLVNSHYLLITYVPSTVLSPLHPLNNPSKHWYHPHSTGEETGSQ